MNDVSIDTAQQSALAQMQQAQDMQTQVQRLAEELNALGFSQSLVATNPGNASGATALPNAGQGGSSDPTQKLVADEMKQEQDHSVLFGAQEYMQQMQSQKMLTQISNAQNQSNNFLQTMASNAKSAVAKD